MKDILKKSALKTLGTSVIYSLIELIAAHKIDWNELAIMSIVFFFVMIIFHFVGEKFQSKMFFRENQDDMK